jgi:Na+/H+-dicarboxylate symporter
LAFIVGLVAFMIRTFAVASPLQLGETMLLIYVGTLLILSGLVAAIGFLGGKLTFPYD